MSHFIHFIFSAGNGAFINIKKISCNGGIYPYYYRDKLVHLGSNPVSTAPSAVSTGVALGKSRGTLLSAHNAIAVLTA